MPLAVGVQVPLSHAVAVRLQLPAERPQWLSQRQRTRGRDGGQSDDDDDNGVSGTSRHGAPDAGGSDAMIGDNRLRLTSFAPWAVDSGLDARILPRRFRHEEVSWASFVLLLSA